MKLFLCFLLQLFVLTVAQRTILDSPDIRSVVRLFRNWILQAFGEQERKIIQYTNKLQEEIPPNVPFPCNLTGARSPTIPDSVHRLRPGDIDVIAALGDSLTSGMGIFATNLVDLYVENRGAMAIIGGEKNWRKYLTIPNILKEFNPNLIGYSLGDSLTSNPASQLNVAEIGAMSRDMPFMAQYLVNRIKNDKRINIEKHWKIIFILIGFNDICTDICVLPSPWSTLENHKKDLLKTLRILRDNLPRTFIGLIIPTHLREIVNTENATNSLICYVMRTIFCSCLFSLQYKSQREEYFKIMSRWQEIDEEISKYPEFHTNDFTVIPLPGIKDTKLPLNKNGLPEVKQYFSADCFHISQVGNARSANTLWNNLLQPIGKKTNNEWLVPFEKFLCPTSERPYLATFENS
ncbi:phospholipase B1, membrane-associated [Apis mellifera caucasica]|uniref:Phospholipase B1, membrane-associated n=1 Tax=Apis mellifera TaxID=7460 RepID=A0A7M7RAV8_APIME|nr:phospholipase B1, membrane-associated [Apis mellifera]KAG6799501.1 phospholipase B1, membrane-associated [Apis mellifera caucasica]KAG9434400.1 phospholipase B1, membrane-associated [Apis mellifera carnica]|eukprot:XP_624193.2 phospholipase B1, membrane-associated [Apis mellifera]